MAALDFLLVDSKTTAPAAPLVLPQASAASLASGALQPRAMQAFLQDGTHLQDGTQLHGATLDRVEALEGALMPIPLTDADRGLINALAAFQLRYGKAEEALALLQLTNRLWPDDRQTLRLLTQAFLHAEDYTSADMTEQAFRRLSGPIRATRADLLRQAVVHLGCLRLSEARASLMMCFGIGRDAHHQGSLS